MEDFDAHDIDTSVKLDNYEHEQWQQTTELGEPAKSPPQTDNTNGEEYKTIENDTDTEHEEEPSLFDILQDDKEENNNNHDDNCEQIGQK